MMMAMDRPKICEGECLSDTVISTLREGREAFQLFYGYLTWHATIEEVAFPLGRHGCLGLCWRIDLSERVRFDFGYGILIFGMDRLPTWHGLFKFYLYTFFFLPLKCVLPPLWHIISISSQNFSHLVFPYTALSPSRKIPLSLKQKLLHFQKHTLTRRSPNPFRYSCILLYPPLHSPSTHTLVSNHP